MITTLHFKFGFIYKNVRYAWKDKKLFRLPFISNNRCYGFKEVPQYCFKSTIIYNIQRDKLTINRLKLLTKSVDWSFDSIQDSDCPF